jgi:hypothetical protein
MDLKTLKVLAFCALSPFAISAQIVENVDTLNVLEQRVTLAEDALFSLKKLKISGYLQPQFQSAQIDSMGSGPRDMKVGTAKNGSETDTYNRFGNRRGRLKATYEDNGNMGVLEFEMTEKSVTLKNGFVQVIDPWIGYVSVKGGVYDRPFGYEIAYSSSRLESPERSRITQTLFPDESDLGAMLILQAPKASPWYVLKLEAGLFAGNGISIDTDSKKDFIGHLSYNNATPTMKYGFGLSFYDGSILQPTNKVYSIANDVFVENADAANLNGFAKRQYMGVDGQFSVSSPLGVSAIRAEYLTGTQPGSATSSSSPAAIAVVSADTYIRSFSGGYVQFVQDIADTKHSITLKYDWYDPNTKITGDKVGLAGSKTGKADMAYQTLGLGYFYRLNQNVKLSAYYDIITNETTKVKGYFHNVNDNLITIRMQYKF